jgi:uncharacterized protein YdaU (DUF1376 family)
MARPWYSFYPSDYSRDTGHLTLIEHGAYRVLMDHYYATVAPLPPDIERLLRLCRPQAPAEKDAVRFVLGAFFVAGEEGFRHPRIDAEIEKAAAVTAKCVFAGKLGAAKRQRAAGMAAAPVPAQAAAQTQPSQSPLQPQKKNKSRSQKIEQGFEEFWSAYPRREAIRRFTMLPAIRRARARAAFPWRRNPMAPPGIRVIRVS